MAGTQKATQSASGETATGKAMPIEIKETSGGKLLEARLTGKLVKQDYEQFAREVDRFVQQQGKINMLLEMHDFHGWTAGALWEDTKFAAHHFRDIERLAVVGEKKWQHGAAVFSKPFTTATIRYFDHPRIEEGRAWAESG